MRILSRNRSRGFTLIELLIVVVILVLLITVFLTFLEVRHRTVVKTVVVTFCANYNACKKIAAMSPKSRVSMIFRPADAEYNTYYVSSDIQKTRYFKLPPGVTVINSNGIIENHAIRIGLTGIVIDEFGNPRKYPNPGILTFRSIETSRVFEVMIDPVTGTVTYQ